MNLYVITTDYRFTHGGGGVDNFNNMPPSTWKCEGTLPPGSSSSVQGCLVLRHVHMMHRQASIGTLSGVASGLMWHANSIQVLDQRRREARGGAGRREKVDLSHADDVQVNNVMLSSSMMGWVCAEQAQSPDARRGKLQSFCQPTSLITC